MDVEKEIKRLQFFVVAGLLLAAFAIFYTVRIKWHMDERNAATQAQLELLGKYGKDIEHALYEIGVKVDSNTVIIRRYYLLNK